MLFTPISTSSAWTNGSYASDPANYAYTTHYGTHDWIADAALQALMAADSNHWKWLNDRKAIYLTGTEAPDNSGVSCTLDGTAVTGFGDTAMHHIYFNEDGTIKANEDDSGIRAKSTGDLANAYFSENKLDLAAFYLGAMTHYIADMAMFGHVAQNNVPPYNIDFDTYHSTIEGYVNTRTNEYQKMEEFFLIKSFTIGNVLPYDAAKIVAWDTYKDPNPTLGFARDAVWLHNNHFTSWKQTYATRADDTTIHQQYYDRIEESLNNAIYYCAAAINNRIEGGDSGEDKNKVEEDPFEIPGFPLTILAAISFIATMLLKRYK
jgi:hypothetical protein